MDPNTTEPTSSFEDSLKVITMTDALMCVLAICLAIFLTTANTTTIVVIWYTPSLHTRANVYVCSLAVADFVVGLVCILLALFLLPPLRLDLFFKHIQVCALLHGLNVGLVAVSTFHMSLIAVDRYLYIIKPYLYERFITFRTIYILIGAVWFGGLTLALMPQFIAKPYEDPPVCDTTLRLPIWYLFYVVSTLYVITCAVNIIIYSVILRAAAKQRSAVQAGHGTEPKGKGDSTNMTKGAMKSLKFFLTVFGIFFVCITPSVFVLAIDYYADVSGIIYRLFNLIALTNSGMNFFIAAIMNKQFRQALLKTSIVGPCFKGCCGWCLGNDSKSEEITTIS